MHRLNILIHQTRPAQQISLHQACNAQGVFNVRIADNLSRVKLQLASDVRPDLIILDHGMACTDGKAVLRHLSVHSPASALLWVGQARTGRTDLARQARRQGLWVINELPWPLSMPALQGTLQRLRSHRHAPAASDFQTVMIRAHAR